MKTLATFTESGVGQPGMLSVSRGEDGLVRIFMRGRGEHVTRLAVLAMSDEAMREFARGMLGETAAKVDVATAAAHAQAADNARFQDARK